MRNSPLTCRRSGTPARTVSAPSAASRLGSHFGSLDAEFSKKLEDLADRAVADLEKQERLEKEKVRIECLKQVIDTIKTIAAG